MNQAAQGRLEDLLSSNHPQENFDAWTQFHDRAISWPHPYTPTHKRNVLLDRYRFDDGVTMLYLFVDYRRVQTPAKRATGNRGTTKSLDTPKALIFTFLQ